VLQWDLATDNETGQDALTYNLRIGTTPDGSEILSPMSDLASGFRYEPGSGNVYHSNHWRLKNVQDSVLYWSVQAVDNTFAGSVFANAGQFVLGTADAGLPAPPDFHLAQNYPNPFNPATTIAFDLPAAQRVEISVYDISGRRVATLLDGLRNAGRHTLRWNGKDDNGKSMPSGVYFYRISTPGHQAAKKMILLK
nr:T9SS type A sorting domain-containing protein [Calditrichia bacterium]